MSAVVVGSAIYLCGGLVVRDGQEEDESTNELMTLDLFTGDVKRLSKMRQKREYHCLIGSASEDTLYAIGGWNPQMGNGSSSLQ